MAWSTEEEKYQIHDKWNEKVFMPRGTRAPEFLDKEPIDHYKKRLMDKAAPFVAADLQEVKTDHLYGSALDHYEQRYFESAAAETARPTNVPDGTLKQVTKYDATGRPFYEFWGQPASILSDNFAPPKKQLASIIDNRRFQKGLGLRASMPVFLLRWAQMCAYSPQVARMEEVERRRRSYLISQPPHAASPSHDP